MKEIRISISLLQYFASINKTKLFAYYCFLKYRFTNSKLYQDGLRAISRKFNLSPATLKTYLNELEALGLIKNENGIYVFLKQKDILRLFEIKENNHNFWLSLEYNIKDTRPNQLQYLLESLLLKNNLNQQQYIISKKQEKINLICKLKRNDYITKKEYSIWKKLTKLYFSHYGKSITNDEDLKKFLEYEETVNISNIRIGQLVNKSKSTGSRRQSLWNDLKIIRSFKRVKIIIYNISFPDFIQMRKFDLLPVENCYYQKGNAVKRLPNGIRF
jgi:DNA-binding Lrp family transcriptional regulator